MRKFCLLATVVFSFVFGKNCSIIDYLGLKDSSRQLQLNCAISYSFYLHLILHAYTARFDVTRNLKNFWFLSGMGIRGHSEKGTGINVRKAVSRLERVHKCAFTALPRFAKTIALRLVTAFAPAIPLQGLLQRLPAKTVLKISYSYRAMQLEQPVSCGLRAMHDPRVTVL